SLFKKLFNGCYLWIIEKRLAQKVFFHLYYNLCAIGMNTVIKIQVRYIGADKYQVALIIPGNVIADMARPVGSLHVHNFIFRVQMSQKRRAQFWVQYFKRAACIRPNIFDL